MYDEIIPVFTRSLNALSGVLAKAGAHCAETGTDEVQLLDFSLAPDMWPLHRQVRAAADHCRRALIRLWGERPEDAPEIARTFAGHRDFIAAVLRDVAAADRAELVASATRALQIPAGTSVHDFTGATYIRHFILPNHYFHATTAYVILRHKGVKLGKMDFIGGL